MTATNKDWITVTPQIASAWLTKYPNELPLPVGINIPFSAYSSLDTPTPTAPLNPTNPMFSSVRSGGGIYYLLPVNIFVKFKALRDKILSKKQHRRLHPLV